MLSVHRGHQLAAVELVACQEGDFDISQKSVAGSGRQRACLNRVDRAADDRVDLDLHDQIVALHEELRLTHVRGRQGLHFETALAQGVPGNP